MKLTNSIAYTWNAKLCRRLELSLSNKHVRWRLNSGMWHSDTPTRSRNHSDLQVTWWLKLQCVSDVRTYWLMTCSWQYSIGKTCCLCGNESMETLLKWDLSQHNSIIITHARCRWTSTESMQRYANLVWAGERKHNNANHQVCDSQRHYELVGGHAA